MLPGVAVICHTCSHECTADVLTEPIRCTIVMANHELICAWPTRYRDQRDITQPESMNLHLETRFEQLKVG